MRCPAAARPRPVASAGTRRRRPARRGTGLLTASDAQIFKAARAAGIDAVLTKDEDFVQLLEHTGSMGNTPRTTRRLPSRSDGAADALECEFADVAAMELVEDAKRGLHSMTERCARCEISRRIGY